MGVGHRDSPASDKSKVIYVVSAYWVISISMVYVNKMLMSDTSVSINAPLFVTWYQCFVTCLICYLCGSLGEMYTASYGNDRPAVAPPGKYASFFKQFPRADYDVAVGKQVLPLSIVFVGMITFNNLCLKLVEVSFYNVARSLTIVFNVVFTYFLLGTPSSRNTIICLGVVVFGFLVGSGGEMNFSAFGTFSGILSSFFVSLNSIFTKKVLPYVGENHWKLTFYNNVNACLLFTPLILLFELPTLYDALSVQFLSPTFWLSMSLAGFFGFAIGIVTVLQIKVTSPLTHNISGTAKAALQSLLAFYIWGNTPTTAGLAGIASVLGGSLLYTQVKMQEAEEADKSRLPQTVVAKA